MGLLSGTHLKVGDPAPDFTLQDQAGRKIRLAGLKGKRVILYFYPKADTPGCTKEACAFRDEASRFPGDVVILGVSKDSIASEKKFSDKFRLTFPLLSDEKGEVIKLYGVDFLFGFAKRVTFLIDRQGSIAKVFEKVDPDGHVDEVREALKKVS